MGKRRGRWGNQRRTTTQPRPESLESVDFRLEQIKQTQVIEKNKKRSIWSIIREKWINFWAWVRHPLMDGRERRHKYGVSTPQDLNTTRNNAAVHLTALANSRENAERLALPLSPPKLSLWARFKKWWKDPFPTQKPSGMALSNRFGPDQNTPRSPSPPPPYEDSPEPSRRNSIPRRS